jgi:prepilin-type N-terminal cleavage/methylation domain-containing protein
MGDFRARTTRASAADLRSGGQRGYTLIELLLILAVGAVLISLSALSLRHYWHVRAFEGAADSVVSQMRGLQTRVVSETHPLVYGARFIEGLDQWGLVRYDPMEAGPMDDTCVQFGTRTLGSGTFTSPPLVEDATFALSSEQTFCRANLTDPGGTPISAAADAFVFFYARGSATGGVVVLRHQYLDRTKTVLVRGITGRVVTL